MRPRRPAITVTDRPTDPGSPQPGAPRPADAGADPSGPEFPPRLAIPAADRPTEVIERPADAVPDQSNEVADRTAEVAKSAIEVTGRPDPPDRGADAGTPAGTQTPAEPPVSSETSGPELPPKLADGVELIGETAGSGFKEPPSLVRRGDGSMIQLTRLLHLVAEHANGERDHDAIAAEVTEKFGRPVSADNIRTLVDDKLRPLGVMAGPDGSSPAVEKSDPLLALKFRKAILPEGVSLRVASLFKPLFFWPVVVAALVGLVGFDAWLFLDHGVAQGFHEALYHPSLLLFVLALVVISAGWHEFGHAAGCAYGGARPGAMGCGVYLVYPAFYTDVTDSYRLDRRGKLRTDLAGVYFNVLFILAMAGLYFLTGFEALLLVILVQHIEIAHQLLPFLRLDGYYVIADLTGAPDMFSRIKPILVSMVPWKRSDEKVKVLKPWVRLVVTIWVVLVIPLLIFQLGMLLLHAPRMFATAADSLSRQADTISRALDEAQWLPVIGGAAQSLILVVPLLGLVLTFARLGGRVSKKAWTVTVGRPASRLVVTLAGAAAVAGLVYTWLPNGDYEPIRKGEKGTLSEGVAAIGQVATGRPSIDSRQQAAEKGRLAPVDGPVATPTTVPGTPTTIGPGEAPVTSATVRPTASSTPAQQPVPTKPAARITTTTRLPSPTTTTGTR